MRKSDDNLKKITAFLLVIAMMIFNCLITASAVPMGGKSDFAFSKDSTGETAISDVIIDFFDDGFVDFDFDYDTDTTETTEIYDTSDILDTQEIPDTSDTPDTTDTSDTSETKDTPDHPLLGDADFDGIVNSGDALKVLRMSAGLDSYTDEFIKFVDVDYDGRITSADALEILRFSAGLSKHEKIEKPI